MRTLEQKRGDDILSQKLHRVQKRNAIKLHEKTPFNHKLARKGEINNFTITLSVLKHCQSSLRIHTTRVSPRGSTATLTMLCAIHDQ